MAEPEELFKDFHKEERHSKHETNAEKGNKMEGHKEIHIKIKFKPIFIERMVYSIVIIILLILLFLNPFGQLLASGSNETNVVVSDVNDTDDDSADSTDTSDDTDTTDDTTDDTTNTSDDTTTVTPDPEPVVLSGEVTFAMGVVELNEDKTRVESITVSIDNQWKLFSPILKIYFYDTDSIDSFKTQFSEVPLPLLIAGKETTKKIQKSELDFSYLRSEDEDKETFKVELYDGNELLDTKTKVISTS